MDTRTRVEELVRQGKTTREISEMTGFTESAIRYHREPARRRNTNDYKTNRRRSLKQQAIGYSGGSCLKCGYNKCVAALTFHHLDPVKKDLAISSYKLWHWEKMLKEIVKTILLCNRCHTEVHDGLWRPNNKMIRKQQVLRERWMAAAYQ